MSDGFFSDTHVTEAGLQGSLGPSVGMWDMVQQGFRQQYRVDSAFALDQELHNRWQESLRAAGLTVNVTGANPYMMRDFAQFVRDGSVPARPSFRLGQDLENMGQPVETGPDPEFEDMRRANEAIRQLNNPRIRTFEQILEEVSAMQHGVEEETASMSERTGWGGSIGELLGAIGGSFTLRDPLNVITAPVGAGRTVAMRIATDMAVAGGVTAVTEFTDVAPNRALAGLPERNPYYDIVASTLGAGLIRGGIEGIGAGVRNVRGRFVGEDIDFNLRDTQLQQMFNNAPDTPTTRAGIAALDDTIFIERNNPYGEGQAAQARFLAELQEVQRAMNGEPMTAIARVLPPMPFEMLKKAADFEIVREQAPLVYARMEEAQARLQAVAGDRENLAIKSRIDMIERLQKSSSKKFLDEIDYHVNSIGDREYAYDEISALFDILDRAEGPDGDKSLLKEARQRLIDLGYFRVMGEEEIKNTFRTHGPAWEFQLNKVKYTSDDLVNEWQWPPEASNEETLRVTHNERKTANVEYQAAYRAVEAEAARLHEAQAKIESAQRRESASILLPTAEGRPFVGPVLQHDYVESLVDRINKFNDTLDEAAVARFTRETVGEGVERETWRTDAGIDIGLKEPVDPEFRFETDGGEMTVADAMRDLQDDTDLDDAMRTCML